MNREKQTNSPESTRTEKLDEMPDYETVNVVTIRDTPYARNDCYLAIHQDCILENALGILGLAFCGLFALTLFAMMLIVGGR